MKTENLHLDIKRIFIQKKTKFHRHDIAHMRYLCKNFVEYILDTEWRRDKINTQMKKAKRIKQHQKRQRGLGATQLLHEMDEHGIFKHVEDEVRL